MHVGAKLFAFTAVGTAVGACCVSNVAAQTRPALVIRWDGVEKAMADPLDARLRDALGMLTQRLPEIPDEIRGFMEDDPDAEKAAAVLDRLMPVLASLSVYPVEFAVLDNGENDLGVLDMDVRLLVHAGDDVTPAQLTESVSAMLRMAGPEMNLGASPANPSLLQFNTPMGTLLYGPTADNDAFAIGLDFGGDGLVVERVEIDEPDGAEGVDAYARLYFDGEVTLDLVERMMSFAGQGEAMQGLREFRSKLPEGGIGLDILAGFDGDGAVGFGHIRGLRIVEDVFAGTIDGSTLRMIPEDAWMAQAGRFSIAATVDLIRRYAPRAEVDRALARAEEAIGFHPVDDFINHLGSTWIGYTSMSTGGAGMTSFVVINRGVEAAALVETLDRAASTINGSLSEIPYVRIAEHEDTDFNGDAWRWTSLTFPGLPVPLEISWTFVDDAWMFALTPQTLKVGLDQATEGNASILDNPRFAEATDGLLEGAVSLEFMDMPAAMDRGYSVAQLLGVAVSNFVRSPGGDGRDPGAIVPPLNMLRDGARPYALVSYMEDGDLRFQWRTDASWLVQIAGTAGVKGMSGQMLSGVLSGVLQGVAESGALD